MREIGVGLVGYGVAGAHFHAPVIAREPRLRLRAVVTSREVGLAGVRRVSTVDDLLNDPAIELVVVATPTATHAAVARAALEAGRHVVVDKPFTPTTAEADELIDLAHRSGVVVSVYHNRRWDDDFLAVRSFLDAGQLGDVYHYEAHFDRFRPVPKAGWREDPLAGSGVLYDLGSHLIDQALVLFGTPDQVLADVAIQRPTAHVADYFHIVLRYGRLRAILHAGSVVRSPGPHFQVHGDAGSVVTWGMDPQEDELRNGIARPAERTAHWTDAEGVRHDVAMPLGDYAQFYSGIADSIENGAPPPVTAAEGREVIAIIEAAMASARS